MAELIRLKQIESGSYLAALASGSGGGTGAGFPFSGSAVITGSLYVSGAFTASLQEGYIWVGNSNGESIQIQSSSFVGTSGTSGLSGDLYVGNSSDTLTLPTTYGQLMTLTASADLSYTVGQSIIVSHDYHLYFIGEVELYNSVTGQLEIFTTYFEGSGTFNSWQLNLAGATGQDGSSGTSGSSGSSGSTGSSGSSGTSGFAGSSGTSGSSGTRGSSGSTGSSGSSGTSGFGAFPYTGSAVISGSLVVTGSVSVSGSITGSLLGTSSFALTASYALNGGAAITASINPPVTPEENDLWYDLDTGKTYIRLNDGTSTQWVLQSDPTIDVNTSLQTLQEVTDLGSTTTNVVSITNTTNATDTGSGALIVDGGAGFGLDVHARAFYGDGSGLTGIVATATNVGTLQQVTSNGNTTSGSIILTGTTNATSRTSGILRVAGGIGVEKDIWADNFYGTASLALTASYALNAGGAGFPFSGSAVITGSLFVSNSLSTGTVLTASLQQGYVWVGDGNNRTKTVPTSSFGGGGSTDTGSLMVTGSVNVNVLTFTKGDGSTFDLTVSASGSAPSGTISSSQQVIDALPSGTVSGSQQIIDLGFVTTSSFQSYTSSNDSKVTSLINATGSYATTGSNTFTGSQTFNGDITANSTASFNNSVKFNNSSRIAAGNNPIQLDVASGSIVLSAPSAAPSLTQLGFVSSSAVGTQVNLIFRNGTATTDLVLSGSNNILGIPGAPSAGFKKYLSESNLVLGSRSPEITGSSAFSPNLSGNIFANQSATALFLRSPISSSTYTITSNITLGQVNFGTSATNHYEKAISGTTFTQNGTFGGTFNATAFTTNLTNSSTFTANVQAGGTVTLNQISSSLTLAGNILNSTALTVNNEYSSSGTSVASSISPRTNFNVISGVQHGVTFSGTNTSTSQTKEFFGNIVVGTFNSSSVPTGDKCNIVATGLIGNSLVITGSSTTGASNASRVYDGTQGSMFVGRYNAVDGTRNLTAETVFAVGTGNALSNRKTGFLIDSGSNTFVEGSLNVSGSTKLSGSFYIQSSSANLPEATGSGVLTYDQSNGQVKFSTFSSLVSSSLSCGEFWSTTTQSGSAGVSGSITFNNSGSVSGVSLSDNTKLTIVNPGTYNIQFSAQIESSAGADTQYIWFKKNGTTIADSATKVLLANNTAQVMTVNILDTAVSNDYYELAFENKNGHATILYEAASGSVPAIPSVIATVTQVK